MDDILLVRPFLGHGLNQLFNCDVRDTLGTVVLLIRHTSRWIFMQAMTWPTWHTIWIGMKCRSIDPVLGDVLNASMRYHHDLWHRFHCHSPSRTGIWRHYKISGQCK